MDKVQIREIFVAIAEALNYYPHTLTPYPEISPELANQLKREREREQYEPLDKLLGAHANTLDGIFTRHEDWLASQAAREHDWWDNWLTRFKDVVTGSDMPTPPGSRIVAGDPFPSSAPSHFVKDDDEDIPF